MQHLPVEMLVCWHAKAGQDEERGELSFVTGLQETKTEQSFLFPWYPSAKKQKLQGRERERLLLLWYFCNAIVKI